MKAGLPPLIATLTIIPIAMLIGSIPYQPSDYVPPTPIGPLDYPNTWMQTLGGVADDYPWFGIYVDDYGYTYILGQTKTWEPLGAASLMLVKNSRYGENVRSILVYGNSSLMGRDLVVVGDATIYAVGQVTGYGAGSIDGYIVKFYDNGTVEYFTTIGSPSADLFWNIAPGYSGDFYLSGYTMGYGAGKFDAFVVKVDADGRVLWAVAAGGSSYDYGWAVDTYLSYNGTEYVIVAGQTKSYGSVGGSYDALVFKLDSEGMLQWSLVFGTPVSDAINDVCVDQLDGSIYVVGYTKNTTTGKSDVLVAKISPSGELVWVKAFGGPENENAYSVAVDNDYVYVAGYTNSFITGNLSEEDALLAILDKDTGDAVSLINFGGPDVEIAYGVAYDAEYVYLAGYTGSFSEGGKDFFQVKLSKEYLLGEDDPPDMYWVYYDYPEPVNVSKVEPMYSELALNSTQVYLQVSYVDPVVNTYQLMGDLIAPNTHIATVSGMPPAEITTTTETETVTETTTVTETETVTSIETTTVTSTETSYITYTATETVTNNITLTETTTVTETVTETETLTSTTTVTETETSTTTYTTTETTTVTDTTTITHTSTTTVTETTPTTITRTVADIATTAIVGVALLLVGVAIGSFVLKSVFK